MSRGPRTYRQSGCHRRRCLLLRLHFLTLSYHPPRPDLVPIFLALIFLVLIYIVVHRANDLIILFSAVSRDCRLLRYSSVLVIIVVISSFCTLSLDYRLLLRLALVINEILVFPEPIPSLLYILIDLSLLVWRFTPNLPLGSDHFHRVSPTV